VNTEFDLLRSRFPKKRQALPSVYETFYEQEYKRNRGYDNATPDLKQKLENWMHRQVSNIQGPEGSILEIGAGTLNHLKWEQESCAYDIVEPFTALYRSQPGRTRLRNIYLEIADIPPTERYTKILSIAVLEHVEDLPHLVARSALLLNNDGVMAHGIPSEGGLLWSLAWRLGTGLSFRIRTGLSYAPLMHHEHINNATEILNVLGTFFDELSYKRFPLPFLHGSFYTCVTLRKPNKHKAALFLEGSL
jgi:hypothetical protein